MRSREAGAAWAALAVVLTGVVFAALAAWTLFARSTIPVEFDGVVTSIELRHEKHPGVDDVWMVAVDDGRARHVDRDVAALVKEGDTISKRAWDRALMVNGDAHEVSVSDDARAMFGLAPALGILVSALVAFTSWRARIFRRAASGSSVGGQR